MDLQTFLVQARTERGFSQRELGEKCGVSAAEICRIENGQRKNPAPGILHALSDTLLVSYPYLLQLAGYMNEEEAGDPEEEIIGVFQDEESGQMVDAVTGAREMMRNDASWANTAYRVSRELGEEDRRLLNDMAQAFLKRKLAERQNDPGK